MTEDTTSTTTSTGGSVIIASNRAPVYYGVKTEIGTFIGWESIAFHEAVLIITTLFLLAQFVRIAALNVPKKFRLPFVAIPEQGIAILFGILFGFVLKYARHWELFVFNGGLFFEFFIPPTLLHVGYFINRKHLVNNLPYVVSLALFTTLMSIFPLGLMLWGLSKANVFYLSYTLVDFFLLSTVVCLVDHLVEIYDETKLHHKVVMILFAESFLNNAISIDFYRLFEALHHIPNVQFTAATFFLSIAKLLYSSIGGVFIGVSLALFCAFLTRFTKLYELYEPLLMILFAFLSYYIADSLIMAGHLAILSCSLTMSYYVELNIGRKSHIVFKNSVMMLSHLTETIVFIFVGFYVVIHNHYFDPVLFFVAFGFSLFARLPEILFVTAIKNIFSKPKDRISLKDQLVITTGGLRGNINYALIFMIPEEGFVLQRNSFITILLFIICCDTFFRGYMFLPMFKFLNINLRAPDIKLTKECLFNERSQFDSFAKKLIVEMKTLCDKEELYETVPTTPEQKLELMNHISKDIYQFLKQSVSQVKILQLLIARTNRKFAIFSEDYDTKQDNSKRAIWATTKLAHILAGNLKQEVIEELSSDLFKSMHLLNQRVIQKSKEQFTCEWETKSIILKLLFECNICIKVPIHSQFSKSLISIPSVRTVPIQKQEIEESKEEMVTVVSSDLVAASSASSVASIPFFYTLSEHCNDDRYLYFIQRELLNEILLAWRRLVEPLLSNGTILRIATIGPLIETLIHILNTYEKSNEEEVQMIHNKEFTAKVFAAGMQGMKEATMQIAGVASPVRYFLSKIVRKIDYFVQRICVRNLCSEEKKLVEALSSLKRSTQKEVFWNEVHRAKILCLQRTAAEKATEEIHNALQQVEEHWNRNHVNLNRIMAEMMKQEQGVGVTESNSMIHRLLHKWKQVQEATEEDKLLLEEEFRLMFLELYSEIFSKEFSSTDPFNLRRLSNVGQPQQQQKSSDMVSIESMNNFVGETISATAHRKKVTIQDAPIEDANYYSNWQMKRNASSSAALASRGSSPALQQQNEEEYEMQEK